MPDRTKTYDWECSQCGFVTRGWSVQADADTRGAQHEHEHKTGEPMPELADFTKER